MKRNDEPTIVSLESHRRRKLAESRKPSPRPSQPKMRGGVPVERAINWRRVPIFLLAVVLLLIVSWMLRKAMG